MPIGEIIALFFIICMAFIVRYLRSLRNTSEKQIEQNKEISKQLDQIIQKLENNGGGDPNDR